MSATYDAALASGNHLALMTGGKLKCHCGEPASHLIRCQSKLRCGTVLARCGGHNQTIYRDAENHCA